MPKTQHPEHFDFFREQGALWSTSKKPDVNALEKAQNVSQNHVLDHRV
jgi:hypothetical protein